MNKVEEGIVGIITNHRFLTNPTFKGMRQSLLRTFDHLYFIDLHGSNKPKENSPNGGKDENVFDIEQGVAMSILVKKNGLEKKVFHNDWWGARKEKYDFGWSKDFTSIEWKEVNANAPFYLFEFKNEILKDDYEKGFSVKDIFPNDIIGFYTGRDNIAIAYNKDELRSQIANFNSQIQFEEDNIKGCLYRPFDYKFVYYAKEVVKRMRATVMPYMLEQNIAITIGRSGSAVSQDVLWNLIFISDKIVDLNLFSRGGANVFPVYKYNNEGKNENLSFKFRHYIENLYGQTFSAEQILGYIYAILHSPTYRTKYAEFLKRDFPKILFTLDKNIFEELSDLGWQLIQAHLLKHPVVKDHANVDFKGTGNEIVDKAMWNSGKLFINKTQWFEPVTKEVYEFYIGGYQVLDKYLKDRKGRNIQKEIYHMCYIIQSLQFTVNQMKIIETKTSSWI